MDGAHSLQTMRRFASLDLQLYDTRLAASVEMFEVARPILRSGELTPVSMILWQLSGR